MPDLRIVVASHKPYWMPEDPCYLPIQVGAAGKETISTFQRDDEGDNISTKNPNYCELTGLYWAWRNLDAEYVGLVHYRRHFESMWVPDRRGRVASGEFLERVLMGRPAILPVERNYLIETGWSHYAHAHHIGDLAAARAVIAGRCPEYLSAFDRRMSMTHGHRFNMLVMRRDLLDAYCSWLFEILFELEGRIDTAGYSDYDRRVLGFVGERLLDVWVDANHVDHASLPVANLESQRWPKKCLAFLGRMAGGANSTGLP